MLFSYLQICRELISRWNIGAVPIPLSPYLYCTSFNKDIAQAISVSLSLELKCCNEILENEENQIYFAFSPQQTISFYLFHSCVENNYIPYYDFHLFSYQIMPNFDEDFQVVKRPLISICNCVIEGAGIPFP